jgi:hypothetical protein
MNKGVRKMGLSQKIIFKGSRGETKAPMIIFVIFLVAMIFVIVKYGTVYNNKWKLEDKLEKSMQRLEDLGEYGIFDLVDNFVIKEGGYNFKANEACTFVGEIGYNGKFECTYTTDVVFPGYTHTMHIHAIATTSRIKSKYK